MVNLKQSVAAAAVAAGLLIEAVIVPTVLMRPPAAPTPSPAQRSAAAAQPADRGQAAPPAPATPTAAPTSTPTVQPKGKRVFIDPGHGGQEIGTAHTAADGSEDVIEKDINLTIAQKLAAMLVQEGYDVVLSRTSDTRPVPDGSLTADLQARVDMANNAGADLFVSVHHNGSVNPSVSGTEVYYCAERPFSDESARLARLVAEAIVSNLKQAGHDVPDRGVKDEASLGHFAVLAPYNLTRATRMPGILGEALFLSNDQDAAQIKRPEVQTAIARGYLQGIDAFFANS